MALSTGTELTTQKYSTNRGTFSLARALLNFVIRLLVSALPPGLCDEELDEVRARLAVGDISSMLLLVEAPTVVVVVTLKLKLTGLAPSRLEPL
jgi:hypothetical protein